jgi:hypothetical protein
LGFSLVNFTSAGRSKFESAYLEKTPSLNKLNIFFKRITIVGLFVKSWYRIIYEKQETILKKYNNKFGYIYISTYLCPVKAKEITSKGSLERNIRFNAVEFFQSLPLPEQGKVGFEFSDSNVLKDLQDSVDSINKLNKGDYCNRAFGEYKYPFESINILNSMFSDKDFMFKLLRMAKLLHLGKTASQVLDTEINLFIKKGTSIGTEYIVARTAIQSFKYVNGVRKATTKRYSAHVGLLSKYPKKLNDPQVKIDALPKLYNKILNREFLEK